MITTMMAVISVSRRVGQTIFAVSDADLPQELAGIDSRHAQTFQKIQTHKTTGFAPFAGAAVALGVPRNRPCRSGEGGRSGGTRTPGPRFWRPMLYQLSYTPKPRAEKWEVPDYHDAAAMA